MAPAILRIDHAPDKNELQQIVVACRLSNLAGCWRPWRGVDAWQHQTADVVRIVAFALAWRPSTRGRQASNKNGAIQGR